MEKLYCGIDLHQRFSTVCVMDQAGKIWEEKKLMHKGGELRDYFLRSDKMACVFEPMDRWGWLSDYLVECGHEVHMANPYKVKLIAESRTKTDRVDARILAELLRLGYLPEGYIAHKDLRDRRSFLRYRMMLIREHTRCKNQIHRLLRLEGTDYPEVTDLFGKCGRAWLEEGCSLRPVHERIKGETLLRMEQQERYINQIDRELKSQQTADSKRLMTMPGIGLFFANLILAEVGDVRRFRTAKQFAGYTGLVCSQRSSGGRQCFGKITKQGNKVLRWAFVEAAHKAKGTDLNLKIFYDRIAIKKGRGRATVALARKLSEIAWHILRDQKDYDTTKTKRRVG